MDAPKAPRRRLVWVLLLFVPFGFGRYWYVSVGLLLISALLTITLSNWGRRGGE